MKIENAALVQTTLIELKEAEEFLRWIEYHNKEGFYLSYERVAYRGEDPTEFQMGLPKATVKEIVATRHLQLKNALRELGVIFPEDEVPLSMG